MRTIRVAMAAAVLAITPALADTAGSACAKARATDGMRARLNTIARQIDRIEVTTDRAEQRQLLDLHMKHVQEGLRELRRRDIPDACRIELMGSMMEAMVRSQLARGDDR